LEIIENIYPFLQRRNFKFCPPSLQKTPYAPRPGDIFCKVVFVVVLIAFCHLYILSGISGATENAGQENDGQENDGQKCNTQNALIDH